MIKATKVATILFLVTVLLLMLVGCCIPVKVKSGGAVTEFKGCISCRSIND